MTNSITRRDFLKIAGLLSADLLLPQFFTRPTLPQQNSPAQNILVIVFDAFSAYHLSLYGYSRKTTPNIDRLADKAIVYHNHFAAGNFTTTGTGSLLTGTYPWTHRAMVPGKTVAKDFTQKSLFHAFPTYHRMAYTHNPFAEHILETFFADIDVFTPRERLFRQSDVLIDALFKKDEDIASLSWARALKQQEESGDYSLYFSQLYQRYRQRKYNDLQPHFPRGVPNINTDNYFLLEDGIDWLNGRLPSTLQPFLGYYHFLPPHSPYAPRDDFFGAFAKDGYRPPRKPRNVFHEGIAYERLIEQRTWYDEFVLNVDAEFARLYHNLEQAGILDNTWVILTSDHGELFERGVSGHSTSLLYQPIIRIPLAIFPPGQTSRVDVFEKTSAVDILPTLAHFANQDMPEWVEGTILPPFNTNVKERTLFAMRSDKTETQAPMKEGSITLIKEKHKLIYYFGFDELQGSERVEFYDITNDPDELIDLYPSQKEFADEYLAIIKNKMASGLKNLKFRLIMGL